MTCGDAQASIWACKAGLQALTPDHIKENIIGKDILLIRKNKWKVAGIQSERSRYFWKTSMYLIPECRSSLYVPKEQRTRRLSFKNACLNL